MGDAALQVWFNGTDTVVAYSAEDAFAVWLEHSGERAEDYANEFERRDFLYLSIVDASGDGKTVTKTRDEWIAETGRGFLCSTEF